MLATRRIFPLSLPKSVSPLGTNGKYLHSNIYTNTFTQWHANWFINCFVEILSLSIKMNVLEKFEIVHFFVSEQTNSAGSQIMNSFSVSVMEICKEEQKKAKKRLCEWARFFSSWKWAVVCWLCQGKLSFNHMYQCNLQRHVNKKGSLLLLAVLTAKFRKLTWCFCAKQHTFQQNLNAQCGYWGFDPALKYIQNLHGQYLTSSRTLWLFLT